MRTVPANKIGTQEERKGLLNPWFFCCTNCGDKRVTCLPVIRKRMNIFAPEITRLRLLI